MTAANAGLISAAIALRTKVAPATTVQIKIQSARPSNARHRENEDSHVPFSQLKKPPHKSLTKIEQPNVRSSAVLA